jgi:hypothetical protein
VRAIAYPYILDDEFFPHVAGQLSSIQPTTAPIDKLSITINCCLEGREELVVFAEVCRVLRPKQLVITITRWFGVREDTEKDIELWNRVFSAYSDPAHPLHHMQFVWMNDGYMPPLKALAASPAAATLKSLRGLCGYMLDRIPSYLQPFYRMTKLAIETPKLLADGDTTYFRKVTHWPPGLQDLDIEIFVESNEFMHLFTNFPPSVLCARMKIYMIPGRIDKDAFEAAITKLSGGGNSSRLWKLAISSNGPCSMEVAVAMARVAFPRLETLSCSSELDIDVDGKDKDDDDNHHILLCAGLLHHIMVISTGPRYLSATMRTWPDIMPQDFIHDMAVPKLMLLAITTCHTQAATS